MGNGLSERMLRHRVRLGMEAIRQPLDLAGVEHAIGFLETEDAGPILICLVGALGILFILWLNGGRDANREPRSKKEARLIPGRSPRDGGLMTA